MRNVEELTFSESAEVKRKCQIRKRRTLMERYLMITCLTLCVAFIAMIGLLVHLVYYYHRPTVPVCLTPLCMNEAGRILSYMDLSVDPCEDFYAFSCGSFKRSQPLATITSKVDPADLMQYRMIELAKELLEATAKDNDPEFVKKVKKVYSNCVNSDCGISKIIETTLQKAGLSWPLLEDSRVDLESTFAKLMIYGNISPFVFIFRSHDGVISIYCCMYPIVIKDVSVNSTDIKDHQKKNQYRKLLEYALYKAKTPFHLIKVEADNILELNTVFAKVSKNSGEEDYNQINTTKSKLLQECKTISFAKAITYVYDYFGYSDNFTDETPIKVYGEAVLRDVCEALNTADKRTFYNYMVWLLLTEKFEKIDPYFTTEFNYNEEKEYNPPAKWKQCIYHMMYYYACDPGISYLVLKHLQPDEILKEVEHYFTEMREQLEEMFTTQSWMDEQNRAAAINQMWDIGANFGYSSIFLDEELLNEYFKEVNATDDYIENNIELTMLNVRNSFFKSSTPFSGETIIFAPIMSEGSFDGKRIELKFGLLSPPFFIPKGPKFTNYAVTSFTIAHEITHAFGNMDLEYFEANRTSKWSNETIEGFIERKRCFEEQYSKFPIGGGNTTVNGTFTFEENIADHVGVIQGFKVYEKQLKAKGEEPQLPGLKYTSQQMFFLSYAQQWCEHVSMQYTYEHNSHSPGKYRVIGPVQNSPQFSEVYKCPKDSPMNPSHKCSLFG